MKDSQIASGRGGRHRSRPVKLFIGAAAWVGTLALSATPARACGVSSTGVASCSLEEHAEETRPHWVAALNGLHTATHLRFGDGIEAREVRSAALVVVAYLPTRTLVLQAGIGAALGGSLTLADGKYEFSAGPTASLGADWRIFDDGRWFALLTSALSVSAASTHAPDGSRTGYEALDLRLGGQLGIDIAHLVRPDAVARVVGGPVFWHYAGADVTGTDTNHYQVGAGLGVRLSRSFNAFAEGVPFGERALSAGVGAVF